MSVIKLKLYPSGILRYYEKFNGYIPNKEARGKLNNGACLVVAHEQPYPLKVQIELATLDVLRKNNENSRE